MTIGSSVFEETATVHVAALRPPIHVAALPSCALWRQTCAREDRDTSAVGATRCVGLRAAGLHGGATRCMGLTHTSGFPGGGYALHGTHSHIILELQGEVGGWRWLSGVRRCVSRKTHTHLTTWLWLGLHQLAPLPVSRSNLAPTSLCRFTPANNTPTPAFVSPKNKLVPKNMGHFTPANDVICNYQLR